MYDFAVMAFVPYTDCIILCLFILSYCDCNTLIVNIREYLCCYTLFFVVLRLMRHSHALCECLNPTTLHEVSNKCKTGKMFSNLHL